MSESIESAEKAHAQGETPAPAAEAATAARGRHEVTIIVHILGEAPHGTQEFVMRRDATLRDLMVEAARLAGLSLLPPDDRPFDRLHQGDERGTVIEDLDETVGEFSRHFVGPAHFTLELVRAFRVNVRWDVAPEPELSPRAILALPRIHLDYKEYTLYPPDSDKELPLDTPVKIKRGDDFEAQRDGKYGKGPVQ